MNPGSSPRWLPSSFMPPERFDLQAGYHLRPLRASDLELDYPAVMGSQPRLWQVFGEVWGWPPASMTQAQDLADLIHREDEMVGQARFHYAVFDQAESALVGCVYLDPAEKAGAECEVCWWVVDDLVGTPLEQELSARVPVWVRTEWPFTNVRVIGQDCTWAQWRKLPARV